MLHEGEETQTLARGCSVALGGAGFWGPGLSERSSFFFFFFKNMYLL